LEKETKFERGETRVKRDDEGDDSETRVTKETRVRVRERWRNFDL